MFEGVKVKLLGATNQELKLFWRAHLERVAAAHGVKAIVELVELLLDVGRHHPVDVGVDILGAVRVRERDLRPTGPKLHVQHLPVHLLGHDKVAAVDIFDASRARLWACIRMQESGCKQQRGFKWHAGTG